MKDYVLTQSMTAQITASFQQLERIHAVTPWDSRVYVQNIYKTIRRALYGLPFLFSTFKNTHFLEELAEAKTHVSNELNGYYVSIKNNIRSFRGTPEIKTELTNVFETVRQVLDASMKDAYSKRKSDLMR